MLTDTHVHLYLDRYEADRDAVVERARAAGVGPLLQPAVDVASIGAALALCDRYPATYAMAGIHPSYVHEAEPDALAHVQHALSDPRVVAVGETGLDYYWTRDHDEAQRQSLAAHARLAIEHDLPIVLHSRDVEGSEDCVRDLLAILRDARAAHPEGQRLRGVFHCFGGPAWLATDVLDLGFHVGLGGTLTFKNGGVPDAILDVPLGRIVLETDGPYLAPTPHRGQRNEPSFLVYVAQRLAELRGLPVEAIAERTSDTARSLFGLPAQSKSEQDMK